MANHSNPRKHKHLTSDDRKEIEDCLNKRMTFKAIATLLQKDPTTISYEVKHHLSEHRNGFTSSSEHCPILLKAPFVCNGCSKRSSSSCHFVHFYYRAAKAHQEYLSLLTDAREGTPLNKEEFYVNDRLITAGLIKGQHLYHIMANEPAITCSKSTAYRFFKKGYFSASVLDLPRAVKFKPRKQHKEDSVPSGIRAGRTYDDFLAFLEQHHLERHTELDTVIGRIGGKVILTIHFSSCNFMAGLLLDNKSAAEAASRFSSLKDHLSKANLPPASLFDVFLADNGGEFSDVFSFENNSSGQKEISMFFCDLASPSQKPQIEKNHTLFRDIVPKGSSFDDFSQETVNLILSHVNSVSRSLYGGKSAYDMFTFLYSDKAADALGISRIPPDQVIQSPLLLKGLVDLKKNL